MAAIRFSGSLGYWVTVHDYFICQINFIVNTLTVLILKLNTFLFAK